MEELKKMAQLIIEKRPEAKAEIEDIMHLCEQEIELGHSPEAQIEMTKLFLQDVERAFEL